MNGPVNTFLYRNVDLQHDLAVLVDLLKEVEQVDATGEVVTEERLREQLTWSGQDPALNNWVVTLPESGTLVAYGLLQKVSNDENADFHIAVHPAWRRRGIGSQLFTYLLKRAAELDTRAMRVYVNVQNEGASHFVRSQGFTPVSAYTRLSVAATNAFPAPQLPEGFTVQSYDTIQRVEIYTGAMNSCYEGL